MDFTLATYNIHRCIGADGQSNPDRVLAVLRELNADIVALQEVETVQDGGLELLARFAAATGHHFVAGPTVIHGNGHYGNALLLPRLPYEVHHIDLSVRGREPRAAIDVYLEIPNGLLRIVATHLGLRPKERRDQTRRILHALENNIHPPSITVLMGDLNEWFLWGRPLRWLRRYFSTAPELATFPARFPIFSLDRIWVHPRAQVKTVNVWRSALARVASDHLPLRAVVAV